MNSKQLSRRSYSSPLRNKQREATKEKIIIAVAEIINEGRLLSFSINDVAKRAKVSYGTVYRHFPTKEKLLEALNEFGDKITEQDLSLESLSLAELTEQIRKTANLFENKAAVLQACSLIRTVNNDRSGSQKEKNQKYIDLLVNNAGLSLEAATKAAAVISHLHSFLTWSTLRKQYNLSSKAASDALIWALRALLLTLKP